MSYVNINDLTIQRFWFDITINILLVIKQIQYYDDSKISFIKML